MLYHWNSTADPAGRAVPLQLHRKKVTVGGRNNFSLPGNSPTIETVTTQTMKIHYTLNFLQWTPMFITDSPTSPLY